MISYDLRLIGAPSCVSFKLLLSCIAMEMRSTNRCVCSIPRKCDQQAVA
jgi:hypothetical protein